jgi:hypothetical protein
VNVYQAVAAVMSDVEVVRKADRNQQQGYSFRGIDAVINAVGPMLRKHGVIVVPTLESSEYATVVIGAKRTEMGHAQIIVTFTWYGPEGDSFQCRVAAEAMDSGDKAVSKAHSVALRTALIQTLALPTDEVDPDASTYQRGTRKAATQTEGPPTRVARAQPEPPREPPLTPATTGPKMISKPQIGMMQALFTEKHFVDRDDRIAYVRNTLDNDAINSSAELTSAQASRVIEALQNLEA